MLTDFGIATFQDDPRLTQTGMVMGSPGFTAPERIRGEDASPASDLWSLGATLFAAVEGHGPFENRGSAITTMSAIINEDAPAAPTAGPLGPVIAALLRREPADRPDAAAATRMITDVLPQLPAPAGLEPPGYEPTALSARSGRPRRALVAWPGRGRRGSGRPGGQPGSVRLDSGRRHPRRRAVSRRERRRPPRSPRSATRPATTRRPTSGRPSTARGAAMITRRPRTTRRGGGARGAAASGSAPAPAPPDFSSWYDPSPRSGATPQARRPAGLPASAPGPGPGPAPRRRRRQGPVDRLGAARPAGGGRAAPPTVVLVGHGTGTPSGQAGTGTPSGQSSTGTAGSSLDGSRPRLLACRSSTRSTATRDRSRPGGPPSRTRPPAARRPASPSPSPPHGRSPPPATRPT